MLSLVLLQLLPPAPRGRAASGDRAAVSRAMDVSPPRHGPRVEKELVRSWEQPGPLPQPAEPPRGTSAGFTLGHKGKCAGMERAVEG